MLQSHDNQYSGFTGPSTSRSAPRPLVPLDAENRPTIEQFVEQYRQEIPSASVGLDDRQIESYGILYNGKLSGFVLLRAWPDGMQICDLYVHPSRRRLGIGSRAIEAVKSMARVRALLGVSVRIRRDNLGANLFWLAQEFVYTASHHEGDVAEDVFSWPPAAYRGVTGR